MTTSQNECKFSVRYDGPATVNHMIDARDLATSIMGLNDVIDVIANQSLSPGARCELQVNAQFREGSAIGDFVIRVINDNFPTLISHCEDARELLGVFVDFITLKKLLQGKEIPEDQIPKGTPPTSPVNINIEQLNINNNVRAGSIYLLANRAIDKQVSDFLSPIAGEKIKNMEVLDDQGEVMGSVTQNDVPFFEEMPPVQQETTVPFKNVTLVIHGLHLDGNRTWNLSTNETHFNARILDQDFLNRVESREFVFGRGDCLKADVEMKTTASGRIVWTVTKVHQLIPSPKQGTLF